MTLTPLDTASAIASRSGFKPPEPTLTFSSPPVVAPRPTAAPTGVEATAAGAAVSSQSPLGRGERSTLDMDSVYRAICEGKNRSEAVTQLVEQLAKWTPGVQVRCGLGSHRLRRVYDARLGWIGTESVLYRSLSTLWSELSATKRHEEPGLSMQVLKLAKAESGAVALVCFVGENLDPNFYKVLEQRERTLATLLWSRPRYAIPKWASTRGRPRVALLTALVMVCLLLLCPVPYRTSCTLVVQPVQERVLSVPFEATLEEVLVEPGDEVEKGQTLLQFDGRPIRLELQSIEAEIQSAMKQQDIALATGKIADAQLAQLKVQQLKRRKELLEQRLDRLSLVSPIDGMVVAGDLRKAIGSPMELGKVLLEIAPLDRVMIELEIPECEIGYVRPTDAVHLRVDSARVGTVDSNLQKIYPSAQLRDDDSVFVAPIELDNFERMYRPGMKGRATIYGPVRPWAWVHVRGLVEKITWMLGL